ncbi:MAG: 30S ribosomal protein S20 [Candidatus Omnitrophota bacterium]
MPIRKKAIKSLRQSAKRKIANKRVAVDLKKQLKKLNTLTTENKLDDAKQFLQKTLFSKLDKAAKKGIIEKNTASRKKSRLTKKITVLGKSSQTA